MNRMREQYGVKIDFIDDHHDEKEKEKEKEGGKRKKAPAAAVAKAKVRVTSPSFSAVVRGLNIVKGYW